MLTLVQIRAKYLSRNVCSVYCSYFFIPSLILMTILGSLANGGSRREKEDKYNFNGTEIESNIDLFNQPLVDVGNTFAIVTEEKSDCNIIEDILKTEISCEKETDLVNDTIPIVKIINDHGKYDFQLIQDTNNTLFSSYSTSQFINLFISPDNSKSGLDYYEYTSNYRMFLQLQSLFTKFLIKKKGETYDNKQFLITTGTNSYPYNNGDYPSSEMGASIIFTIIVCLQFSMTTYFYSIRMVDEKEKKLSTLLIRLGVSRKTYFFSWLIYFIILAVVPLFSFIIFYALYLDIHTSLFFINILLFTLSIFSFVYFFYTCISTTKTAAIIIKFVNFTSAILGFPIAFPQCSKITKVFFAFIPQMNVYLCSNAIDKLSYFTNLSWEKLWLKADKFSYMESIIMYFAEIILYTLLSVFVEKYNNSGLPFFQFIKSRFVRVSRNVNNNQGNYIEIQENNNEIKENNENINNIIQFQNNFQELTPLNKTRKENNECLKLVNICKNFDTVKAVDNFNGELFGNEIFCLLGHNGAGKTTLVNMISGIYDPNHGDIFYNGRSIVTDKDYLFENIGVCQQEDIFFHYLTVSEHLEYMSQIKGSVRDPKEISELLIKIGLAEKSGYTCGSLSGGQKRKLCTALALIGNSNIILLDEPTSGMDPSSKKQLWDFLKNYQKNKVILITTHSLEEAEYLGDRIGIMHDGHFVCCGTSSYLKSKYPCGLNINLLIDSEIFNEDKKKTIFETIQKYDPEAEINVASKSLFSIKIQTDNEHIQEIFNFIDETKEEYGIEDYTVASTSLEDVFLKINNKSDLNDMKYVNKNSNELELLAPEAEVANSGFCEQLISQLHRNFCTIKRNKIMLLLEYFSGLGVVYIFIFLFSDLIYNMQSEKLNLIDVLEENRNYITDSSKDLLKNSYVYDSSSFITLKTLEHKVSNLEDLINYSYDEAFANIAPGSIMINKNGGNYNVYLTQINIGYLFANTMFTVSSFLKQEYGIDAMILSSIEQIKRSNGEEQKMNSDTIVIMIIVCVAAVFGYVIYLGGLTNEKIKERKTNIKHLLYLSGSNSFSYWIAFFIIDYLKLIVFSVLLIVPIYHMSSEASYYLLLEMLIICFSSLSFIYFVSFFGTNAGSGVKFLFILLLAYIVVLIGLLIFIAFLSIFAGNIIRFVFETFNDTYNFTFLDMNPISSMLLSFLRIIYSLTDLRTAFINRHGPKEYLGTTYMVQMINFFVYSLFLVLMETGHMAEFLSALKKRFCISERNFVFSREEMSDEFLVYNNPLLANQINNDPINPPLYTVPNSNNQNNINNNMNINNNNRNIMPLMANNNMNMMGNNINNNLNFNNANIIYDFQNPLYGNMSEEEMNKPIYGNNLGSLNIPIYDENNNNINDQIINSINDNNISKQPSESNIINTNINDNIKQPLLEEDEIITTNSNNKNIQTKKDKNYTKKTNYKNNINIQDIDIDEISQAINEMALPEINTIFNVRKGNPYVNYEKDKVMQGHDFTTKIEGLKMTYYHCCKKPVRAINNLYLGLEANEKFGLLGFNGSGKTTAFKSITNEILYDYGKITLFGVDTRKDFYKIRPKIGYCPQENPLFEYMKVREILEFYSDLKTCNIPIETICEKFGLTKYLDTFCINLSGGNKRKLTFAIAIMNKPTLLLLDEPSTGVDPESRRYMWKNINELSNTGHKYNMILTTHSMEEAEIMCDRVSWLKRGNFVCIGNPEKLKIQFSLGYKLHVKFNDEIINQNIIMNNNIQNTLNIISSLVIGFRSYSMYILNNPAIEPYLQALIDVVNRLRGYTVHIILVEIGKDLSFKLIVKASPEMKANFFTEILTMKKKHKEISEMIISMESLENILTSF